MKRAIIQCADSGPLESIVCMLAAIGYDCCIPSARLRQHLKQFGGLVLANEDLVRGMGYDPVNVRQADSLANCDLFVDIKAHQTYHKIVQAHPNLAGKILYYRIQGGRPEHVVNARGDHGDEVCTPCPILTPNQWYTWHWKKCKNCKFATDAHTMDFTGLCPKCNLDLWEFQAHKNYCCWPPFVRMGDYDFPRHEAQEGLVAGLGKTTYEPPICLIHGFKGWGYGDLLDGMKRLGVRIYGQGSPDGLIQHSEVPRKLAFTLAMVHLKSSDAPGYALYEALAAKCPIICTRKLIWKCQMQDLFIPDKTCLVFDKETHDGFTAQDVEDCCQDVKSHLERLKDPAENKRIGEGGYNRLMEVMWNPGRAKDVESLGTFMEQSFKY